MQTYSEIFEKAQNEFLTGLKQAQELNVKAIESFTTMFSTTPAFDFKNPISNVTIPTASELVERTFAFTNEMLEVRKQYLVKLAEIATETQQQFADAAKRMADAAKN